MDVEYFPGGAGGAVVDGVWDGDFGTDEEGGGGAFEEGGGESQGGGVEGGDGVEFGEEGLCGGGIM